MLYPKTVAKPDRSLRETARMSGGLNLLAALSFAALCMQPLSSAAQNGPDFKAPRYASLLADYNQKTGALAEVCRKGIGGAIDDGLKEVLQKVAKAKISGNAGAKADSAELEKIFKAIKAAYLKGEPLPVPEKVRPGNERVLANFNRKVKSFNDELRRNGDIQLMKSRDELRKLLETDGFKANAEAEIERYWTAFRETGAGAQASASDGESSSAAAPDPEDGGDKAVYATFGQSASWKRFARIDTASAAMEIISVPLFPMEKGKTQIRGQSISGSAWQAFVTAPASFKRPAKKTAFRLKSVEGMSRIEPVTWPSPSNNWTFELRVKPAADNSASACLIEIGE